MIAVAIHLTIVVVRRGEHRRLAGCVKAVDQYVSDS